MEEGFLVSNGKRNRRKGNCEPNKGRGLEHLTEGNKMRKKNCVFVYQNLYMLHV